MKGRIIGRQPLPSIGEVFSEVQREENRRFVMLGKKNLDQTVENSALATEVCAGRMVQGKLEEKPCVWCDYCNKPKYTCETCWKLHGKLANWRGKHESKDRQASAHEAETVTFSKE